jgi:adenosylcobinamide-GDP ribazoletransferase
MLYVVFIKRQIGGFTGDTLGAAQQFFELLIYLVLLYGAL